jgi:hypothetical protein
MGTKMKTCTVLVFLLFLHATVAAQQPDTPASSAANAAAQSTAQAPPPKTQKAPPTAKPARPKPLKRTNIDATMVGYIDPSPVQTQVRVRFDAGFDAPRPDRAEYFYAGCNGSPSCKGAIQRTLNFQELYLLGEYAPRERFSAFVQVPFRWIQPMFVPNTGQPTISSGGGISDVQAGLKLAVVASGSRNLTVQFGASFPSGDGSAGLGTNHFSFEPKLLLFQRLSDRSALEAEAGDSHPIGGTVYFASDGAAPRNFAADVAMYGIGPSYAFIRRDGYSISPVLEVVSWHVFGGLQTGSAGVVQSAAGINVLNAKLGARVSFSNGSSFYAGYGRGLTSDIWYRNLFRIEYRRVF